MVKFHSAELPSGRVHKKVGEIEGMPVFISWSEEELRLQSGLAGVKVAEPTFKEVVSAFGELVSLAEKYSHVVALEDVS